MAALRLHPGRSGGRDNVPKPAVPGVPAPAGLKDRVWDKAVIAGKVAEWPLAPAADFQALVRAKSPTEQIRVTVRQR